MSIVNDSWNTERDRALCNCFINMQLTLVEMMEVMNHPETNNHTGKERVGDADTAGVGFGAAACGTGDRE